MGGGVGIEEGERVAAVGTGERWGSACEGVGLGRGCDRCVGPGRMECWGEEILFAVCCIDGLTVNSFLPCVLILDPRQSIFFLFFNSNS